MIADAVAAARSTFDSGLTKPIAWRLQALEALRAMLVDHQGEFAAALKADLGKSETEAWLTEIGFVTENVTYFLKHLKGWLKAEHVAVPLSLQPATARIVREPLGVVLIISPWNYPVQLLLAPLAGALAAGNTAVLKPSELAPEVAKVMGELVPQYLADAVQLVQGGAPETTELLKEKFDHIFYTGNGQVGRIVMRAAAEHLTPVTLELGGKSPVFIDETVDLAAVSRRLVWGKFLNAGQTCVAPDYVLTTPGVREQLLPHLRAAIAAQYGGDPRTSTDYSRIINDRHHQRLTGLLADADVVTGGEVDAPTKYLAPTVINADIDSPAMEEEIFGPILPLLEVADADAAIRFINSQDKPLALYVFSNSSEVRNKFTTQTSSGGLSFGIPVAHLLVPGLPFGGVGASGMGGYHGKHSLDTFSHRKPILDKPLMPDTMGLIYPPMTPMKNQIIRCLVAPAN